MTRPMWAVRLYPSGSMVCQKVAPRELMNVPEALARLDAGHPACVGVEHLYTLRCVRESSRNWVDRAKSRIAIVEDSTRYANAHIEETPWLK